VVNPPWTLEKELAVLLPALAAALAGKGAGGFRLDWLAREK
jgi:23S rRNA (adenine2030-N6)-methyltransferase